MAEATNITTTPDGKQRERTTWKVDIPTPADVPGLVDVQWNAFTRPRLVALFPHTETGRRYLERDYVQNITTTTHPAPETRVGGGVPETLVRIVRDDDEKNDGKVVAFGLWRHLRAGDDLDWRARWSRFDDIPDMSEEVSEGIKGPSARLQGLVMAGQEHLLLEILCTMDTHRGRGIGSALVEWGNAYADARGIPAFLHASLLGKQVYEKLGFAVQDVSALTDEELSSIPMLRPAREKK